MKTKHHMSFIMVLLAISLWFFGTAFLDTISHCDVRNYSHDFTFEMCQDVDLQSKTMMTSGLIMLTSFGVVLCQLTIKDNEVEQK